MSKITFPFLLKKKFNNFAASRNVSNIRFTIIDENNANVIFFDKNKKEIDLFFINFQKKVFRHDSHLSVPRSKKNVPLLDIDNYFNKLLGNKKTPR
jgi:hypothetical protein